MTIKELIDHLQQLDPDLLVVRGGCGCDNRYRPMGSLAIREIIPCDGTTSYIDAKSVWRQFQNQKVQAVAL